MKIRTQAIHFKADTALLEYVDKKLSKLDTYFDRITEAEVTLKLENSGQVRDKIVEMKLNVPGTALFGSESDKTFEAGVDAMVDNMKRQLLKYKEKVRK